MQEVPKESVGTICSVVRYNEENSDMVDKLFKKYSQKSGSMKSIPQTVSFKSCAYIYTMLAFSSSCLLYIG